MLVSEIQHKFLNGPYYESLLWSFSAEHLLTHPLSPSPAVSRPKPFSITLLARSPPCAWPYWSPAWGRTAPKAPVRPLPVHHPTVIFQLDFAGCLATSGFAAQGAPSPPAGGKKNSYLQVCKWKKVESCSSKPTHFLLAAASESLFLSCFPQLISSWASACIWVFSDCKHPSHLCPILRSWKSLLQHRS